MKIVSVPSPVLQNKASPVLKFDTRLKMLITQMIKTLKNQKDPQGVGLAAPQVGQSLSLFIVMPDPERKPQVFVNPGILKWEVGGGKLEKDVRSGIIEGKSVKKNLGKKRKKSKLEGCLSIPKIWGQVVRSERILLEYQDETGKSKKKWFSGFEAVIIQHEIDHLNGILFTQRVLEQKNRLYREKEGELERYEI